MRDIQRLSAHIHGWLRDAILDVALAPGAAIIESDIAASFGTSRTPVREALLRLADEQLVDILPQRGTYVARLSLARVEEALFIRQAIEGAVMRRIVERGDVAPVAARLASVARAHAAALAADDTPAVFECDTQFHRELIEASGLPGVWDAVSRARELHHRIRAIAVPELKSGRRALSEHRAILKALLARDANAAEAAMSGHLAQNLILARKIAQRHPDYFETATRLPSRPASPPVHPVS